jgi:hypothetical protein
MEFFLVTTRNSISFDLLKNAGKMQAFPEHAEILHMFFSISNAHDS